MAAGGVGIAVISDRNRKVARVVDHLAYDEVHTELLYGSREDAGSP
jgi:hypothetical protein